MQVILTATEIDDLLRRLEAAQKPAKQFEETVEAFRQQLIERNRQIVKLEQERDELKELQARTQYKCDELFKLANSEKSCEGCNVTTRDERVVNLGTYPKEEALKIAKELRRMAKRDDLGTQKIKGVRVRGRGCRRIKQIVDGQEVVRNFDQSISMELASHGAIYITI